MLTWNRNYSLTSDGVCYRTQVAVRTRTLPQDRWEKFIAGQLFESRREEMQADLLIAREILLKRFKEAQNAVQAVQFEYEKVKSSSLVTLLQLWEQIRVMTYQAFLKSIGPIVQEEVHKLFDRPNI